MTGLPKDARDYMAKMLNMGGGDKSPAVRTIPHLLQREEAAAQVVAIMQARIDRPGPEEMQQILHAASEQIVSLKLLPGAPLS